MAASPRSLGFAAGLLAALAGLAALYLFDPATSGIYPVCALHQLTGLQCPGCGGLRAMHQFLHGHFGEAWDLNPLIFFLLPAGLWLGWRARRGARLRPIHGWLAEAVLVLFGVLRNLR
ncbi:MAG: DUF2752 domain-containing protein [Limisphaerales bacterium]